MAYQIRYAAACFQGLVRKNNEDNFYLDGTYLPENNHGTVQILTGKTSSSARPILGVFDGMGGLSCGEEASFLAVQSLERCAREKGMLWSAKAGRSFIDRCCGDMHQSILDYARQGKIKDVGTTMALAVFGRTSIQIANLGDSRIYCLTGNHLERLSRDHVLEAPGRMKPPLVQYLGMDDSEYQMTPHVRKLSYQDNMQLFLCSDGVTDMMSEQEIEEVLHNENSISEKVEKLKKVILQRGARDNTTMILAEILRSSLFG